MSLPVRILSFAWSVLMLGTPAAAHERAALVPSHIRTPNPELRALMSLAVDISPTLRDIVNLIESSDVVVLLDVRLLTTPASPGSRRSSAVRLDGGICGS